MANFCDRLEMHVDAEYVIQNKNKKRGKRKKTGRLVQSGVKITSGQSFLGRCLRFGFGHLLIGTSRNNTGPGWRIEHHGARPFFHYFISNTKCLSLYEVAGYNHTILSHSKWSKSWVYWLLVTQTFSSNLLSWKALTHLCHASLIFSNPVTSALHN